MTLLNDFIKASKDIAIDLGMNKDNVEIEHYKDPKFGLDYTAQLFEGRMGFDFNLHMEIKKEDPKKGELMANIAIYFGEATAPYLLYENIDYMRGHLDFLSRWASWAVFNFRLIHHQVNLESLFYGMQLRVYGILGDSKSTQEEAELLFNGILATQKGKVIIYKFRHINRIALVRSFSYAVWVNPKGHSSFWIFFPYNCGLDSGGSRRAYKHFESLINRIQQKFEVELRKYDVEYEELDRYLLRNAIGFFSRYRRYELDSLSRFWSPIKVLKGSEQGFQKFIERFDEEEYAQALRDLRALLQQAQENVAKFKNLNYSHITKPNVNKLASFLIENQIIDGRLLSWFEAFTAIANLASHKDFPTIEDMKNYILRTRVLLTFYLGIQLLKELDVIMSS